MGHLRSHFAWKALFRWDVLGAVVPGIFVAIGIGMLGVDWFPRNLLISQISFAIGALLCLLKFIGHAIESNDARGHRVVFAVIMCGLVVLISSGFIWGVQKHKNSERPVLT